jgi:hypothetical protein
VADPAAGQVQHEQDDEEHHDGQDDPQLGPSAGRAAAGEGLVFPAVIGMSGEGHVVVPFVG